MIQDVPRSTQPPWTHITREVAAMGAAGLLMPLGLHRPASRTPRQRDQRTTVLVHGYLANRSSLLPVATWLRLRGLGPVIFFDYSASDRVDRAAIALRDDLKARVRGGRIDLVCHSMGGLVARVYLQNLGGARRVDRCITLGTPHEGTYNAYWLWSKAATDLRPDSALLARLRDTQPAAASVRFTSIIAASDNIVVPRVFAGYRDEVVINNTGHISMLFSPNVLHQVAQALQAPSGPATPHPVVTVARRSARLLRSARRWWQQRAVEAPCV